MGIAWQMVHQESAIGFHGGAFVSTVIDHYLSYGEILSRKIGCKVVCFQWTWADEKPYPQALEDTLTAYRGLIARGMYALQLGEWLRSFDADRFMILRLERFDPVCDAAKVWAHAGVAVVGAVDVDGTPKNSREYEYEESSILRRFFRPHDQRLRRLMKKKPRKR